MTWISKQIDLKRQQKLYSKFLKETELTYEDRVSVCVEIGRIQHQLDKILKMPYFKASLVCDDYFVEIPSKINRL